MRKLSINQIYLNIHLVFNAAISVMIALLYEYLGLIFETLK